MKEVTRRRFYVIGIHDIAQISGVDGPQKRVIVGPAAWWGTIAVNFLSRGTPGAKSLVVYRRALASAG